MSFRDFLVLLKIFSGFQTNKQLLYYLILGSLFWAVIVVASKVVDAKQNAFKYTFLTNTCNRNYKRCLNQFSLDDCNEAFYSCRGDGSFIMPEKLLNIPDKSSGMKVMLNFTREEQEYNSRLCRQYIFYDRAFCNELCAATNDEQCKKICYIQRNASPELSQICPFRNSEHFCIVK